MPVSRTPSAAASLRSLRVSSAATIGASPSAAISRGEASCGVPIGTAASVSVPPGPAPGASRRVIGRDVR